MVPESPHQQLSRRERQIMDIIYQRGQATAAEVLEGLPDPPSYSAVRAMLRLLEEKGYLRSFAGASTEERAGRPKKCYEITALGKKAMHDSKSTRDALWKAIPKTILEASAIV